MGWGEVAGMALGIAQNYESTQQYIRQTQYETQAKVAGINATKDAFMADLDAFVINNFLNEQYASNAIAEVQRTAGANIREATQVVTENASKILAQSEGITGGASKARELSSYYVKASKAVNKIEEQGRGQVIKIADTLDKAKNDTAARIEQSYQKMLLSIAGVSPYSSIAAPSASEGISNVLSGIKTGTQLGQLQKDWSASNTAGTDTAG